MGPLPAALCSAAVCRSMPTAHCPLGSNKPEDTQRGNVQNGLHCPLPTAVWHSAEGFTLPMAPSGAAVYRNTNTAHYPLQCGSVLKDLHCPLPTTATHRPHHCRWCHPLISRTCSLPTCEAMWQAWTAAPRTLRPPRGPRSRRLKRNTSPLLTWWAGRRRRLRQRRQVQPNPERTAVP